MPRFLFKSTLTPWLAALLIVATLASVVAQLAFERRPSPESVSSRRSGDLAGAGRNAVADASGRKEEDGALSKSQDASPAKASSEKTNPTDSIDLLSEQMARGKVVYIQTCFVCHQPNGQGLAGIFPPLAKSDYLMADKLRAVRAVIKGQTGEIVVNGKKYNGIMPPVMLNDRQVADVVTYVRNSWGNSGAAVTLAEVRKVRAEAGAYVTSTP